MDHLTVKIFALTWLDQSRKKALIQKLTEMNQEELDELEKNLDFFDQQIYAENIAKQVMPTFIAQGIETLKQQNLPIFKKKSMELIEQFEKDNQPDILAKLNE